MTTKHIVLKVGGAVCADPNTAEFLAAAVKRLAKQHVRVTLVHGGGPQLDVALSALGETVVKHQGLRVTSPGASSVVLGVMDQLGEGLTRALAERGVAARHVPAKSGAFVAVPKDLGDGVDLGRVGTVTAMKPPVSDPAAVLVLTPVGSDGQGPLNVNADEAASAAAAALGADLLLLVTDVNSVRDGEGNALHVLDGGAAQALIASGAAAGGMIPKLGAALAALDGGVPEVWIGPLAVSEGADLLGTCAATGTWVHAVGAHARHAQARIAEATA